MSIPSIEAISSLFTAGTKKCSIHCSLATNTLGNNQVIHFISPSSHNSPKNTDFSFIWTNVELLLGRVNKQSNETAIGRSNLVQIFLISEGERFIIIFFGGSCMPTFLNAALILSFASLIVASGSHIISMVGSALFASASTIILCACNQVFAYVAIF